MYKLTAIKNSFLHTVQAFTPKVLLEKRNAPGDWYIISIIFSISPHTFMPIQPIKTYHFDQK